MKNIIFACVIAILCITSVYAIPSINSASGNIAQGANITISGSGFGVKDPVAPARYADFEDGTAGERLKDQARGGFETRGFTWFPHYSTEAQRIPGEIVAEQHYDYTNYNQEISFDTMSEPVPYRWRRFYASFWIHRKDISGTSRLSTNMKLWGNFGTTPPSGYYYQPQSRVDCYGNQLQGHLYGTDFNETPACNMWFPMGSWWDREFSDWVRVERYIDTGTTNGNDFQSYFKEDLQTIQEVGPGCGSVLTDDDPDHRMSHIKLGHYWRGEYDGQESKTYTSEIYLDTTQARVEIGDAATWDNSTHREIQIPHTTWNDNTIQFTANLGSFNETEQLYLFVVNADGTASVGYPLLGQPQSSCPSHDTNQDNRIDAGEIMTALSDWLSGRLTIANLIQLMGYFKGGAC